MTINRHPASVQRQIAHQGQSCVFLDSLRQPWNRFGRLHRPSLARRRPSQVHRPHLEDVCNILSCGYSLHGTWRVHCPRITTYSLLRVLAALSLSWSSWLFTQTLTTLFQRARSNHATEDLWASYRALAAFHVWRTNPVTLTAYRRPSPLKALIRAIYKVILLAV